MRELGFEWLTDIIARARRMGRIRHGFVLCDNCDTPADKKASRACGWTACAACAYGEADAINAANFISVGRAR